MNCLHIVPTRRSTRKRKHRRPKFVAAQKVARCPCSGKIGTRECKHEVECESCGK